MRTKDIMNKNFVVADPERSVQEICEMMREKDVGFVPVVKEDKIVGMLTDRDVCLNCVADGKDISKAKASDCMTESVLYCYEEDDVQDVASNMGKNQVHRLPVLNEKKRLVGIVSLSDIACHEDNYALAGQTLSRICQKQAAAA